MQVTNIPVYLFDSYYPWQKGSNELQIGLSDNIFHKGLTCLHRQQKLSSVARISNKRPSKILEYETPAEKCNLGVAINI